MIAERQAARVLGALLEGHTPEQVHRWRPEWSLAGLRVAAHAVEEARADLAAMIAAAPKRGVGRRDVRDGES